MGTHDDYVLGREAEEYDRLRWQARLWERETATLLDRAGLSPGARCLDVGSGPGETMRLMAERAGPTGQVIGVDSDERLGRDALDRLHADGLRRCDFVPADIEADDIPESLGEAGFDLVFARLLLIHLTDPVAALRRMWRWTAPGGVLVVQEFDLRTVDVDPPLDVVRRWHDLFAGLGSDGRLGHRLPALFRDAGIGEPDDTHVAGRLERFDTTLSYMLAATYRSARPAAVKLGVITEEEGAAWFADLTTAVGTAGHHAALWPLLIGAYKRKP
jgi:SAM-dependent methyltransferase